MKPVEFFTRTGNYNLITTLIIALSNNWCQLIISDHFIGKATNSMLKNFFGIDLASIKRRQQNNEKLEIDPCTNTMFINILKVSASSEPCLLLIANESADSCMAYVSEALRQKKLATWSRIIIVNCHAESTVKSSECDINAPVR